MNWRIRPARADDIGALLGFAALTGGGMTNLPDDRTEMERRLEWSLQSYSADLAAPKDELYLLVLEEMESGKVLGTCALFSKLGSPWPFYNYRVTSMYQASRAPEHYAESRILYPVTDMSGASEVGGLFVHPDARQYGVAKMLARSRYLFIAQHRERFADRCIAEMRGMSDADGRAPFWDAIGAHFFPMTFREADHHNSLYGNQFISDLMPKYPIYVSILPPAAQTVIGCTHPASAPARTMLEREGFQYRGVVDIFDAGPVLSVVTDQISTLAASHKVSYAGTSGDVASDDSFLFAHGHLNQFSAWWGAGAVSAKGLMLRSAPPAALQRGDEVRMVAVAN